MVPLKGDECLQVSSEQDAHEYLSAVTDIVQRGTGEGEGRERHHGRSGAVYRVSSNSYIMPIQ